MSPSKQASRFSLLGDLIARVWFCQLRPHLQNCCQKMMPALGVWIHVTCVAKLTESCLTILAHLRSQTFNPTPFCHHSSTHSTSLAHGKSIRRIGVFVSSSSSFLVPQSSESVPVWRQFRLCFCPSALQHQPSPRHPHCAHTISFSPTCS